MTEIEYLGPLMGSCKSCSHLRLANTNKPEGTPTVPWLRELLSTLWVKFIISRQHCINLQETLNGSGAEGWTWRIQRTQICQLYPRQYLHLLPTTTLIVLKPTVHVSWLECQGIWKHFAFLSKSLNTVGRNYEIHKREMSAIMRALEEWRHYLQGAQKLIPTTQTSNISWLEKLDRRQAPWSLELWTPMITLLWFMNRVRPWGRLTHLISTKGRVIMLRSLWLNHIICDE